jgi:hypothetical protein
LSPRASWNCSPSSSVDVLVGDRPVQVAAAVDLEDAPDLVVQELGVGEQTLVD